MLYKNYLAREHKELKFWEGAGMGAGEEMVSILVTQNDVVPNEWKDRRWLERGHRFSNLD